MMGMMGEDDGKEKPSIDELRAQEEERHRAREAEVDASWSKTVVTPGTGKPAWHGARATLHVVGTIVSSRSGEAVGSVFEDTRQRGEPHLLLLGRGVLVPGLEKAVQSMREGELATVIVEPAGGYGGGGSPSLPRVPGSAVLRYELELLSLETEPDLWDLEFEQKLGFARERRERGNRLFKRQLFREADEEYEQGLRYLVYMPQVEEGEKAPLDAELLLMQLNLTASKLRCNREAAALAHATKALAIQPEHPKALYRIGQAHTQLGEYAKASAALARAQAAGEAAGDTAVIAAVEKEKNRLQERKERHTRQRKAAYRRMVRGADTPDPDTAGGGDDTAGDKSAGGEGEAGSGGGRSGGRRPWTALLSASLLAVCIAAGLAAYLRAAPLHADGA